MRTTTRVTRRSVGSSAIIGAAILVAGALIPSATASACPVCHTETGRQVRAGIFGEDFGFNLLVSALPFPIFLGIAAALHFGVGARPAGGRSEDSN